MKHIILYSGGISSHLCAERVIQTYGRENVILLFTDTKVEDYDLYRFLKDGSEYLGVPITWLADGRDIWQVFRDTRYLGNSREDPCSRVLKREQSRKFIHRFHPDECVIHIGFGWDEIHRLERSRRHWNPYRVDAMMTEAPYLMKDEMMGVVQSSGIQIPRLYDLGFSHNNCGGGCVKAGIGHFTMLLDKLPDVFEKWERGEQEIREYLGKNVSMLTRTRRGVKHPFTLQQLRTQRESLTKSELCDIGGCGCFESQGNEWLVWSLFGDFFRQTTQQIQTGDIDMNNTRLNLHVQEASPPASPSV